MEKMINPKRLLVFGVVVSIILSSSLLIPAKAEAFFLVDFLREIFGVEERGTPPFESSEHSLPNPLVQGREDGTGSPDSSVSFPTQPGLTQTIFDTPVINNSGLTRNEVSEMITSALLSFSPPTPTYIYRGGGSQGLADTVGQTTASLQTQIDNVLTSPTISSPYITGSLGISTTSPFAQLSVNSEAGLTPFIIGSSTVTSFIVDKSGNVGIGTATPSTKLTVAGNILATGSILGADGTASAPSFSFQNDTTTGLRKVESLWVIDDSDIVYNITKNGTLISYFPTSVITGTTVNLTAIAIDNTTDTLWVATETTVYNITKSGQTISSFASTVFDPAATIEGVEIDDINGTLWVVDDETTHKIYNLQRTGMFISSFDTTTYDVGATGSQEISIDSSNSTLWLIDNETRKIYNITKTGSLINSFLLSSLDASFGNPEGIGIDPSDNTLWVTAYNPDKVYNITKTGTLISSFVSTTYSSASINPTGIVVDSVNTVGVVVDGADVGWWSSHLLSANRLQVTSTSTFSGNLGIGTANPRSRLDVVGNAPVFDVSGAMPTMHDLVISEGTPTDWRPYSGVTTASLQIQSSATQGVLIIPETGSGAVGTKIISAGGDFRLYSNATIGSNLGTLGMTLNTGRVGFGTTTPLHALTIASTTAPQLSLSAGAGVAQWTFRNAGGNLYLATTTVAGTATTTLPAMMINGSTGYVGIATSTPTLGPLTMNSGAYVTAGGAWTNASDRNQKENFATMTPADILAKINVLPITEWNYKTESPDVKHIGPIAQDFYSIFGLGNNDTSISTIDPAGVALIGIQALSSRIDSIFGAVEKGAGAIKNLMLDSLTSTTIYTNEIHAGKINVEGDICVNNTCITKEQFEQMILQAGVGAMQTVTSNNEQITNNNNEEQEENSNTQTNIEEENNTASVSPEQPVRTDVQPGGGEVESEVQGGVLEEEEGGVVPENSEPETPAPDSNPEPQPDTEQVPE